MADPYVRQARGVFSATIGSTAVTAGDLVYFDGTDWELADADDNTKFAEAIAVNSLSSADVGNLCTNAIVVDTDAPYTQGSTYYLSETAGAVTTTRPTTLQSLRQVCGFGLSTTELRMDIMAPYEHHMVLNLVSSVAGETITTTDGANLYGALTNADAEEISITFACPQNVVGLAAARYHSFADGVGTATTMTTTFSGAGDGEQWDVATQDATLTALAVGGAAADEIQSSDLSTGMDAAGIIEPGNVVGAQLVQAGAQTDAVIHLCVDVTFLVV